MHFWFQTFAMFWILYVFCWVMSRITQKNTYKIQNTAKVWNQECFTSMGRILQGVYVSSRHTTIRCQGITQKNTYKIVHFFKINVPVAVTQTCLLGLDNLHIRTVQHLDIIKVLYIHQLMHQWVVFKKILKFTLKHLRHVSVLNSYTIIRECINLCIF